MANSVYKGEKKTAIGVGYYWFKQLKKVRFIRDNLYPIDTPLSVVTFACIFMDISTPHPDWSFTGLRPGPGAKALHIVAMYCVCTLSFWVKIARPVGSHHLPTGCLETRPWHKLVITRSDQRESLDSLTAVWPSNTHAFARHPLRLSFAFLPKIYAAPQVLLSRIFSGLNETNELDSA
jgi:hypothetical protein